MTPPSNQFLRIPLLIALLCGAALLLLFLLVQPIVSVVIGVILLAIIWIAQRAGLDMTAAPRSWLRLMLAYDTPILETISRKQAAVEIVAILLMVGFATYRFYMAGAGIQLSQGEAEWITSSAYAAHDGLRDYGRIPLWQPYLEAGEPLLDNPVSFVLNPFSSVPSLLLGGAEGMKISVVLTTAVAGLGGWFLGRVLGLGWLGRILLGMLLAGKGNMSAMFNTGYFQLAASQAYFPWIIAGVLGIFYQPYKRWPPVMLAVSAMLLLFAGNIWYTLPMFICAALIIVVYLIGRPANSTPGKFHLLRRLMFASVLTATISAALLIPLWLQQDQIGNHPPEIDAGWVVPLWTVAVDFYFNSDPYKPIMQVPNEYTAEIFTFNMDRLEEFYFSYVAPPVLVILLFVLLPIYRPRGQRIWLAAWILVAFFTLWGAGGQPLFLFLYEKIPFLRGWRFVGRALAVASFWLAVLLAMRADSLWNNIRAIEPPQWRSSISPRRLAQVKGLLYAVIVVVSLAAARDVNLGWHRGVNNILNPINLNSICLDWLRDQHPDADLTVWQFGYNGLTAYINNRIRIFDIFADFEMTPQPSTIGKVDLTFSLPAYGIGWGSGDRRWLLGHGYRPIISGPRVPAAPDTDFPCVYQRKDVLSYAYIVPAPTLESLEPTITKVVSQEPYLTVTEKTELAPDQTTPVTTYLRQPDNILLLAAGDPSGESVLTVQERAYPGWRVEIDGVAAQLESVGGQIGVRLPQDTNLHRIYFEYRPPLFITGAWITLAACVFAILYLLGVERILKIVDRKNRRGF